MEDTNQVMAKIKLAMLLFFGWAHYLPHQRVRCCATNRLDDHSSNEKETGGLIKQGLFAEPMVARIPGSCQAFIVIHD